MGTNKIRRKTSTKKPPDPGTPRVVRTLRLRKAEAMELQRLANEGGLEDAKRHLRTMRPKLDEAAVHEVAWRCEDPRGRGGIETGTDAHGDYADLAITE